MIIYQENYGEDIDGNRGQLRWMYDLEESDRDIVVDQIIEAYPCQDYPDKMYITVYDYIQQKDVDIQIDVKEWM